MVITTRTECLLSPNTPAFSPNSNSTSSRTRKRTKIPPPSPTSGRRMTLFTLIYISLAVITLFLSPSAYADRCTPAFISLDSNGDEEDGSTVILNNSDEEVKKNEVVVREGASFKMSCELSRFHSVKWTINNREVTPQVQDEWDMKVETENEMDGFIYSELSVNNASTKFHPGEYKCTSVCLDSDVGANLGVKVAVSIAINVTLNANASGNSDYQGHRVYKKFVAREKRVDLICTAHVPDATMNWYRVNDKIREENMEKDVCIGPDVELTDRKKPPEHCKVTRESKGHETVLKLEIKRVRKEGNETLKTISDFRKYVCRADSDGNQAGVSVVELVERVSAVRSFGQRGIQSLTVVQGEKLEIYCDIHGVDPKEFRQGKTKLVWLKDGKKLEVEETADIKKIEEVALTEKGKPYRVGFYYTLAETEHRGHYRCDVIREGESNQDTESQSAEGTDAFGSLTYYVRVKDKLGALWPFLGICGEVVILCTIILIYEKRKSKAELEESDTDGSPDQ